MQLSDVCLVRSGFSARERFTPAPSGMLALQQGCITPEGTLDVAAIIHVESCTGSFKHIVEQGDVLLRSRGTGVSAWAVDDALARPAIALLPLYILRPTSDTLDAGYLAWLLMRPIAQGYFARESVGSNLHMIRKPTIESLPISLPPISMQRAIASAARLAARELELRIRLATHHHALLRLRLDERIDSINQDRITK